MSCPQKLIRTFEGSFRSFITFSTFIKITIQNYTKKLYNHVEEGKHVVFIKKYIFFMFVCLIVSSLYSPNLAFSQENISNDISAESVKPTIHYSTHVQDIGWQMEVSNGEMSGTEGQAKRLESIRISVNNVQNLGVRYSTHVQDYGWLDYVSDREESGTVGKAKRLESIKIELTGTQAVNYDIYYRVHAENYGWMNWVKNGELAGTTGEDKRLEAIEIIIVEKGTTPPAANDPNEPEEDIILEPSVTYRAQVTDNGWLDAVSDGKLSGIVGQEKRLEAIQISLNDAPYKGEIVYKTHVQDYGWVPSVSDGETSGKPGENKRVEAIQVNVTGEMAKHYDIYYRVYAQSFGWLGWAKNGEAAGTVLLAKPLEAFEVVLVKKGGKAPGSTDRPLLTKPTVVYSTHVETYSWLNAVADGEISGTQGQAKRLEAITINLQNAPYRGDIKYSTHIQDYGWANPVLNGGVSGTLGQSKRIEAIKIELTGEIANYYDVYYRVHSETFGWLGWAKNGKPAGTQLLSKRLEAIQIVLVEKDGKAPSSTVAPFLTRPSVVYSSHVETYSWLDYVSDGAMSGTQGKAKRLEAIVINLKDNPYRGGITYSTHVQDYGWMNNVSNGQVSGTLGQSKRVEAIKMELTGDLANDFDIYYRVHAQDYGWLGWARNGMNAGTEGLAKRLEAVEIKLVPKGQGAAVFANEAFKQLRNSIKVFLDPGHGGNDPGAVSGPYHEADLNLAVAKKVQSILLNHGYEVYMSRHNDTAIGLIDRPQMANDLATDIFVSIHTNATAGGTTSATGIESYYYEFESDYPPKINQAMHNDPERIVRSVTLTSLIQDNMVSYTGAVDRGTDGNSLAVIRESAMPATLVEMGFINNSSDRQKLFTDSYQNKLAQAIADGIVEYFRIY